MFHFGIVHCEWRWYNWKYLSFVQVAEELLFLKAVSLCHTVQISYDQPDCLVGGDPFSHTNGLSCNNMEYYASSPDEKALVEAAKRWGDSSLEKKLVLESP